MGTKTNELGLSAQIRLFPGHAYFIEGIILLSLLLVFHTDEEVLVLTLG